MAPPAPDKRSATTLDGDSPDVRRSSRTRFERDFLVREEIDEDGVIEFTKDERCGLNQPGRLKWTPEETQAQQLRDQGTVLFDEHLRPEGWKWAKRGDGFVFRAPGITKEKEIVGVNTFLSYTAIAEQYEQDGFTINQIMARAKQPPIQVLGSANAASETQAPTRQHPNVPANCFSVSRTTGDRQQRQENKRKKATRQPPNVPANCFASRTTRDRQQIQENKRKKTTRQPPNVPANANLGEAAVTVPDLAAREQSSNSAHPNELKSAANSNTDQRQSDNSDEDTPSQVAQAVSTAVKWEAPSTEAPSPGTDPNAHANVAPAPVVIKQEDGNQTIDLCTSDDDEGQHPHGPNPTSSTTTSTWTLRKRMTRIEEAWGYSPDRFANEAPFRRLQLLECEFGITDVAASFPERISVLETLLGLPPVPTD